MANDVNLEMVSSTDSCHSSDEVAATALECSSDSEEDEKTQQRNAVTAIGAKAW